MRRAGIAYCVAFVATTLVVASAALARHRQNPPPILLVSKAGTQRAAQESFCVLWPPHDGETSGGGMCADTADVLPRCLSIVRPGEVVTIRLRGATSISEGSAAVRVLGKQRYIRRFPLRGPSTRWRVRLRPTAYEVEVDVGRLETGRTVDTGGSLGILVDRERKLRLVRLSAARSTPDLTG